MAYNDLNKKLDWAMSFQRTGTFPLDRSSMFISEADALAYAKQDGTDSRQLGGTSYVGQIICVDDGANVAAYIIEKVGPEAAISKFESASHSQGGLDALQAKVDNYIKEHKALHEQLKAEYDAYVLANNKEIEGLKAQDATLQGNIDAEVKRASDAEQLLTTNLEAEVARAKGEEEKLATNISNVSATHVQDKQALEATLAAEEQRATAAEGVLTKDLQSEVQRATAAENVLTESLNAEIQRSTAAENVLTTNLESEVNRSKEAERVLTENLNAEVARAKEAEKALDGRVLTLEQNIVTAMHYIGTSTTDPIAGATVNGKVDNFQSGDICLFEGKEYIYDGKKWEELGDQSVHATKSEVATEQAERKQEDVKLGQRIDTEVSDRTNADNALGVRIAEEASARTNEDNALKQRASELERKVGTSGDAANAQGTLYGRILQEIEDRKAAVKAEEAARSEAKASLDATIAKNDENVRADFAAADKALGGRIDVLRDTVGQASDQYSQNTVYGAIAKEAKARSEKDAAIEQAFAAADVQLNTSLTGKVESVKTELDTKIANLRTEHAKDLSNLQTTDAGLQTQIEALAKRTVITVALGETGKFAEKVGTEVKIPVATQNTLGLVKSSAKDAKGKVFIESDGTMTVNSIDASILVQQPDAAPIVLDGGSATK